MHTIDNIKFGEFLIELRKEKGYTQKDVAERLGVSDKAVSKWERGLSFPDITLLEPLANMFNITLTELYHSERIKEGEKLDKEQIGLILESSIQATSEEIAMSKRIQLMKTIYFLLSISIMCIISVWMSSMNYLPPQGTVNEIGKIQLLTLIILVYFTFFAKTKLPIYYDQNKVDVYTHGFVRFHIAGLKLNNNNWQAIVYANCVGLSIYLVLLSIIYAIYSAFSPFTYETMKSVAIILLILLMLVPTYIVGKKYE
ncbi:helix-turn-helix domain-containing protein [Anaerorhabdus sp.]|uniref:helix-turn-helix domain-containing protein n=1 Tax=Anaerorhabdus sp. TaxID=1872524 RepID=UPI002FCAFE98